MWVKGHQGKRDNEEADRRARERGRDRVEAEEDSDCYAVECGAPTAMPLDGRRHGAIERADLG